LSGWGHIAAQSQCGSMSAADESGRCIVIATCEERQRIAALAPELDDLRRI